MPGPLIRRTVVAALGWLLIAPGVAQSVTLLPAQPSEEKARQRPMPVAPDQLWSLLGQTKIVGDVQKGTYSASAPKAVEDLSGSDMTISGFMLPLDPSPRFTHFVLSRRTPVCPFCMPGQPNEVVEVYSDRPLKYSGDLVTVSGRFLFQKAPDTGLFFTLQGARVQQ